MSEPANPVTCAGCGRKPEQDATVNADGAPWTWSRAVDAHGRTLLCPACAREHARSIEAQLGTDWW
jgi:hypothetical protein